MTRPLTPSQRRARKQLAAVKVGKRQKSPLQALSPLPRAVAGRTKKRSSVLATPERDRLGANGQAPSLPRNRRAKRRAPILARLLRAIAPPLMAMGTFVGLAGLAVGGGWMGYRLIVDPDAFLWLNEWLPESAQLPVSYPNHPQTLAQIQAQIRSEGKEPGEAVELSAVEDLEAMMVPVRAASPACQTQCPMVELRVFQPINARGWRLTASESPKFFRLVAQVPVAGPAESFVIDPVADASTFPGSNLPLPLMNMHFLPERSAAGGTWFHLTGERVQEGHTIVYGQLFHYNPERYYLNPMLAWTSPAGRLPNWQEVTGGGMPELVVDRTVGLEPDLQVYEVQSRSFLLDPIQLRQVSLYETAASDRTYRNALLLARNGLWSDAHRLLQSVAKRTSGNDGAGTARIQAQLDTIALHATITKQQAEALWVSPSQQALASIIDGRWAEALGVFQTSWDNQLDIAQWLTTDGDRLWDRTRTAIRAEPGKVEAMLWGVLVLGSRDGGAAALTWLAQQPRITPDTLAMAETLLAQLERAMTGSPQARTFPSHILGSAEVLPELLPDRWQRPNRWSLLELEGQQIWYRLRVRSWHDGDRWQATLAANTQSWLPWQQLGLASNPNLEMLVSLADGTQTTLPLTAKAWRVDNGELQLLAAGNALPANALTQPPPLALTTDTVPWFDIDTTTLTVLSQNSPGAIATMLPRLWQELQAAGWVAGTESPTPDRLLAAMDSWLVGMPDLDGDRKPEFLFTLRWDGLQGGGDLGLDVVRAVPLEATQATMSDLALQQRSVLFDDDGTLLYSELTDSSRTIIGAIDPYNGEPPLLLASTSTSYEVLGWSLEQRRLRVVGDRR